MMAFCSSSCSGARPTAIVQSVPVCSPLWRRGLKSTLVSFLEQGLSFPCAPCSAGSGGVSRATLHWRRLRELFGAGTLACPALWTLFCAAWVLFSVLLFLFWFPWQTWR
mgnify:CR=1 FL=1